MPNKRSKSTKKKKPNKPENSHTGSQDASKLTIDGDDPPKTKKSKKKKPSEELKNTDESGKPSAIKHKDQQLEISTNPNDDAEVTREENEIEGTESPEVRRKASTTSSTDQANSDFSAVTSERNKNFEDDMNYPGTLIEPETSESISDINVNIVEQESLIDKQIEKPPDPNDIIVTGKIDNNGNSKIFLHEDPPKNRASDTSMLETEHEILHETYKNRSEEEIRDAKTPSETVINSIRDTTTAVASDAHMLVGKETAVKSSLIENSTSVDPNESQPIDDETDESTKSKNSSKDSADIGENKLKTFSQTSVDNAIKESSTALVVGTKPRETVITDDPISILKTDVLRKNEPKKMEALREDKLRRTTEPEESVSSNNIDRIPDIVEIEKDPRSEESINNVRAVIAADIEVPTPDFNYSDNMIDNEIEVASIVKESTDNVSAQKIIELFENGTIANVETTLDIVEDSPDIVNERNSVAADKGDEAKSNEVERENEIWNGGENTDTMENEQNAVQDEQDTFAHSKDVPGSTEANEKKESPVVVETLYILEHDNDISKNDEDSTKTAEFEENAEAVAVDESLDIEDNKPDTTGDDQNASTDDNNVAGNAKLDEFAETVTVDITPDMGGETMSAAGDDIAVTAEADESAEIIDIDETPNFLADEPVAVEGDKNESKDDDDVPCNAESEESAEKLAADESPDVVDEKNESKDDDVRGNVEADESAGTLEVDKTPDVVADEPLALENEKNELKDDDDVSGTAETEESAEKLAADESPDVVDEKNESKDDD
ncbi:hypothetical protein GcC1_022016, partial [Golovinomyces cichoracearum]